METDSGQRATMRRREGARGRRERRLRAEARIRLQLCRDAVRVASHRGWVGYMAREAEVREQHYVLRAQERPLPGMRPAHLLEELPQVEAQRHTVEQIISAPMLDVPVPLMEEQLLVDAFAPHDIHVPEQVIEVPKILIDELSVRTLVREPQLAEQLVEVPTIISFSSLQRIVEQNVDVPVQRGGVRGLQGFPPGQASTTSSFSLERISERNVEQIAGFSGGGLQDFLPGQSSSSSSHDPARVHEALDGPGEGVFRTFPRVKKKCDTTSALWVGTAPALEPMDGASL